MNNSSKLFEINYKFQFLNNYMLKIYAAEKWKKATYDFESTNGDGTPK